MFGTIILGIVCFSSICMMAFLFHVVTCLNEDLDKCIHLSEKNTDQINEIHSKIRKINQSMQQSMEDGFL